MKFTHPSGSRPLEGYTIKRGVGRGGFGEVYFAISDGGKEVALKLIRRNLDIELRGVMHCLNLKHANLVDLYDVKQEEGDGDTWVVMEFVGGESLEDLLARNPDGLPVEDVLAWMHGIGAGVAYLHDHGIVHRDLKPGNIFIEDGIVKIGDYGLSKFISTSRRSGQTESVGTVHYMAPEVANGRYGKEIDVYALGIILYELLTGRVPFEGESVGEVLMKHLTAQPDLSGLAEPYRTAVARTLEKDPEKRVQSVKELLALLPDPGTGNAAPNVHPGFAQTAAGTGGGAAAAAEDLYTVRKKAFLQDEPIWKATSGTIGQLVDAWKSASLNLPAQVILIVLLVMAVSTTSGLWIPALVFYLLYLGVRFLIFAVSNPKVLSPATVPPVPNARAGDGDTARVSNVTPSVHAERAAEAGVPPDYKERYQNSSRRNRRANRRNRHANRRHHRDRPLVALPLKTPRERFTELIASMLLASGVSAAVAVLFFLVMQSNQPEQFAWMALVGTLGSWGVLIPAKFWEGTTGDVMMRRFVLLVVGLGLGVCAYGTDQVLSARLPHEAGINVPSLAWHRSPLTFISGEAVSANSGSYFYDTYGDPTIAGYMAYFALLFPVLRWWRMADPLRSTRVRVGSIVVCGLWAWVLAACWGFPEDWGVIAAVTIAIAVQMASPWFDPNQHRLPEAA